MVEGKGFKERYFRYYTFYDITSIYFNNYNYQNIFADENLKPILKENEYK
jgi:hypothetical protein